MIETVTNCMKSKELYRVLQLHFTRMIFIVSDVVINIESDRDTDKHRSRHRQPHT